MNKITGIITYLALFILLTTLVSAVSVSLSPASVNVPDMIQGGYYEVEYHVSYASEEPTKIKISVDQNDELAQWIRFEPDVDELFASKNNPQTIKMIIEPPSTVPNGNYKGTVRFSILNEGTASGTTSMVIQPGLASTLDITISSNEISDCRIIKSSMVDVELFENLNLETEIYNNGNIDARPEINYVIKTLDGTIKINGTEQKETIKPTQRKTIITEIEQDLKPGQYFMDLSIPNCQEYKKTSTFDVLEWGSKSSKANLVNLRPENVWNFVGDNIKLFAIVKNTGTNVIKEAQFVGKITLNNVFVEDVKSKIVEIKPGETITFKEIFSPKKPGKYYLTGKVYYDKKETFERTVPINVNFGDDKTSIFSFINILLFVIIVVVLTLLIMTYKKRKVKTSKQKSFSHSVKRKPKKQSKSKSHSKSQKQKRK